MCVCARADAEGRLTLADALWYAQEKCSATAIVDVATLTGEGHVARTRAAAVQRTRGRRSWRVWRGAGRSLVRGRRGCLCCAHASPCISTLRSSDASFWIALVMHLIIRLRGESRSTSSWCPRPISPSEKAGKGSANPSWSNSHVLPASDIQRLTWTARSMESGMQPRRKTPSQYQTGGNMLPLV